MNKPLFICYCRKEDESILFCTNKSPISYTIPTQSHPFVYTSYIYDLMWFEKDTLNTLNSCSAKGRKKLQTKNKKSIEKKNFLMWKLIWFDDKKIVEQDFDIFFHLFFI